MILTVPSLIMGIPYVHCEEKAADELPSNYHQIKTNILQVIVDLLFRDWLGSVWLDEIRFWAEPKEKYKCDANSSITM